MGQPGDPLRRYYAARAPEYDEVYAKPERQSDLRDVARWLPSVFVGSTVLEVACGTGYWTQLIAPVASRVLAMDANEETLRIARARIAGGNVEFVVGDAYALPQATPGCDAGFAGFWISHVPRLRMREFLLGLHAALEPGAKVVLLDNRFVEGSSSPVVERDDEGNTYQARVLRDGTAHRVLKNFPSEHEMRGFLDGLADQVRYRAWQYFWALEYATALP